MEDKRQSDLAKAEEIMTMLATRITALDSAVDEMWSRIRGIPNTKLDEASKATPSENRVQNLSNRISDVIADVDKIMTKMDNTKGVF